MTVDGHSPAGAAQTLSSLADGALADLSFYIVAADGRVELRFADAETADAAEPDRVVWTVDAGVQDMARQLFWASRPRSGCAS